MATADKETQPVHRQQIKWQGVSRIVSVEMCDLVVCTVLLAASTRATAPEYVPDLEMK